MCKQSDIVQLHFHCESVENGGVSSRKQDRQDKFNEALIEVARGLPCLWQHDRSCYYKDLVAKDNSWAEIAKRYVDI